MNCTRCGKPLTSDSRYCPSCGASVSPPPGFSGVPSYPPPPPSPPPPPPPGPTPVPRPGIPPATGPEEIGLHAPPGLIGDCIRTGWAIFQREWVILVAMYVVYAVLTAGPDFVIGKTFGKEHPLTLTFKVGTSALSVFLYPGFIVAGLKAVRGASVDFTDLFAGFKRPGAVLIWNLLGSILTAVGMVLLVLPGVIVALGLSQSGYLVFDRGLCGVDALKASWKLMTGYRLSFLVLMLALLGINVLGLLALCVGFFVTAPLTAVILAVYHERLRGLNGGVLDGATGRL
jgi:hypothetical protein